MQAAGKYWNKLSRNQFNITVTTFLEWLKSDEYAQRNQEGNKKDNGVIYLRIRWNCTYEFSFAIISVYCT